MSYDPPTWWCCACSAGLLCSPTPTVQSAARQKAVARSSHPGTRRLSSGNTRPGSAALPRVLPRAQLDFVIFRLVLPHTLRIEGAVFLILMAQGRLPAVFALPAGLGDIAAGISAPFVARRLARRSGAIRFHLLGIADLVIALSIGFLAGLGPVQVFHDTAAAGPVAA